MLQELTQKLQEAVIVVQRTNERLAKKENGLIEKDKFLTQKAVDLDTKDAELTKREMMVANIEDVVALKEKSDKLAKENEDTSNRLKEERVKFAQFISSQNQEINNQKAINESEAKRLVEVAKKLDEDKLKYKEQVLKELAITINVPK